LGLNISRQLVETVSGLEQYRASESEKARTEDLLRILPKGRRSVLDIGARDGYFSQLLTKFFEQVTALDLEKPSFRFAHVETVAGDVTNLQFPDGAFDCVFCAEVLEHIPDLPKACKEIARVAKHEIVIGVPFRQDTRYGRTTCSQCGKVNPPWGHLNSFDEGRLASLFSGLSPVSKTFVGTTKETTNSISAFLMDLAGNPWGTYVQEEPCIHCGTKMLAPQERKFWQHVCSAMAFRLNRVQAMWTPPRGNWIHLVFVK
jgi:SAM-dependent methyltransferase